VRVAIHVFPVTAEKDVDADMHRHGDLPGTRGPLVIARRSAMIA
jgi:hypothetical protein